MHKLPRTQQTLAKRIATLRALLNQNAASPKLLKAAERVREARIQVLRATIGSMPSVLVTPEQAKRIAQLDRQIETLRARKPTAILAEFESAR